MTRADWISTAAALLILFMLALFPIVNPCQSATDVVCTWHDSDGGSFTNYYGLTLYHP